MDAGAPLSFQQREHVANQLIGGANATEVAKSLREIWPELHSNGTPETVYLEQMSHRIRTMKSRDDGWGFAIRNGIEQRSGYPLTKLHERQAEMQKLYNERHKHDYKDLQAYMRLILSFGPLYDTSHSQSDTPVELDPQDDTMMVDTPLGDYHVDKDRKVQKDLDAGANEL